MSRTSASRFRLLGFVLVILLAACQPEGQPAAATQIPLRVELSPTLEYLSPAISACSMQNPEIQLIVEEKPAADMGKTGAEVSLIWGDHTIPAGSRIFRLGSDRLVFAAHKTNPLQQLTATQVFQLDRGGYPTWADALKQFCPDCAAAETFTAASVDIWHYSPGTEVYAETAGLSPDSPAAPNGRIWLAPSARTLSEVITNNPAAVGWLPARWLNQNLKEITLTEIDPSRQVIPVIATTPGDPSKLAARWLQCLQSSYGN